MLSKLRKFFYMVMADGSSMSSVSRAGRTQLSIVRIKKYVPIFTDRHICQKLYTYKKNV